MKKSSMKVLTGLGVLIAAALILNPLYVVSEGEQAIVIRFGEIVASARDAGLHAKMPFIDSVITYPKKIMSLDGDSQRIPTKENQFIIVDTTSRWRIQRNNFV